MLSRGLSATLWSWALLLLTPLVTAQLVVPLSPSVDPFYTPPAGYESTALGTVLKTRTVTAAFIGLIPAPLKVYQLLYTTESLNGTKIATVTTVFKPQNAATDKFVSFHTAEDSSALKCAPSYNYQLFANQTNLIVGFEFLVLQAYLGEGYIVSSPDYEGPDSAFSPGRLEARGVLDSMRAVNNFASTLGLASSNNAIVGVGYSGGAIATGWAASLQPTYAKELNIKGWVAGGTPANLTGTLVFIDNTTFSGFLPSSFAGLLKPSAYAATLGPLIEKYVTPYGASELAYANEHCATDNIAHFSGKSVLATSFQTLGPQLPYEPTVAAILGELTMGVKKEETPTAPVLLYHASADEIIPYLNASTLFHSWCDFGASVHLTTYAQGGHLTTEAFGVPEATQFVANAFAGNLTSGCSQSTQLANNLNLLALGVDQAPVMLGLANVVNLLGKQDSNVKKDVRVLQKKVPT